MLSFTRLNRWNYLKPKKRGTNCKHKNDKGAPQLEFSEVVPVYCNDVNNAYQHDSRNPYTFAPNKPFASLIDISPPTLIILKTAKLKISHVNVRFPYQNSVPLELEHKKY